MAYDRAGTGPWAWLKSVGSADDPLKRDWRETDAHLLPHCWFSKHPQSLRAGDMFVYYAAWWGVVIGLMELVSDDVHDHADDADYGGRWRWRMDVRPLVTLPMEAAPTLEDVGIEPRRVRRQSHIRLDIPEYKRSRDLIIARATRDVHDLGS